ncbi:MAG: hypothetical protein B7Z15_14120 [Rhizobiales bacterium 32-66-8]|nr:MAG: hypothetical protein B7Z15_14120 [Rhizobiales bacterium 32-66-8]
MVGAGSGRKHQARKPHAIGAGHGESGEAVENLTLELLGIGVSATVIFLGLLPFEGVAPAALEQGDLLVRFRQLGDLTTNLILHTDRRTYLLELQARPDVYMASIAWRYPQDEALALRRAAAARDALAQEPQIDLASLNFEYRIVGDAVPWKPLRAFDDGARVFIEFSDDIDQATLPPLSAANSRVCARWDSRPPFCARNF